MESFCSLQRELHNRVKAAALRTEVLVSIMHIVINGFYLPSIFTATAISIEGKININVIKVI